MSCRVLAAFVAGENDLIMSAFRHRVPHCAAFCCMASVMPCPMSADRGRRGAIRPMRRRHMTPRAETYDAMPS